VTRASRLLVKEQDCGQFSVCDVHARAVVKQWRCMVNYSLKNLVLEHALEAS